MSPDRDSDGLLEDTEPEGSITSGSYSVETLLVEGNTVRWKVTRWLFFSGFVVGVVAMIASTATILADLPICPSRQLLPWWQETSFYLVYPFSFRDADSDGIGDLKGLASEAPYISALRVGAVVLSSSFDSPLKDFGLDVRNHSLIHAYLGSEDDFVSTLRTFSSWGIRVIVDFVPNHTSDEHVWFKKSASRVAGFEDFYVWADGRKRNGSSVMDPPNNWISVRGGSAWTWNAERSQFYLHQLLSVEPDLNLRNPAVMAALDEVLKRWLKLGVAGFRILGGDFLLEAGDLADEDVVPGESYDVGNYSCLVHVRTRNLAANGDLISRWKNVVGSGFLGVEMHDFAAPKTIDFYSDLVRRGGLDAVFVRDLIGAVRDGKLTELSTIVARWDVVDGDLLWLSDSGELPRLADGIPDERLLDGVQMLNFVLPGTPVLYYGDEIGMRSVHNISDRFPVGSSSRNPMQWSDDADMGFSNATPWLRDLVGSGAGEENVKVQSGAAWSRLRLVRKLGWLRSWMTALASGSASFPVLRDDFFSIARLARGTAGYVLGFNTSPNKLEGINLCPKKLRIGCRARVVARSIADCDGGSFTPYHVQLENMTFGPYEAIIGQFTPFFHRAK